MPEEGFDVMAGSAIENSMLGAAHSAANPLTARYGMVHGLAVGIMLPAVMRFNAGEASAHAGYLELANLLENAPAKKSSRDPVATLLEKIGNLLDLAQIGVRQMIAKQREVLVGVI